MSSRDIIAVAIMACVYYSNRSIRYLITVSPLWIDPMADDSMSRYWFRDIGLFILLNIPINSHPMSLLPSIASSNIADRLSKPLPTITHQRIVSLIGADPTFDTLALATPTTSVDPSATVAPTPTVDSLAAVVYPAPLSDSVPTALPIVLDTGASLAHPSDFSLEVTQASYGLFRSPISVVSKALAFTPVDPYTLLTGEDVSVSVDSDPVDLSSPDTTTISHLSFFFPSQLDSIKLLLLNKLRCCWLHLTLKVILINELMLLLYLDSSLLQ